MSEEEVIEAMVSERAREGSGSDSGSFPSCTASRLVESLRKVLVDASEARSDRSGLLEVVPRVNLPGEFCIRLVRVGVERNVEPVPRKESKERRWREDGVREPVELSDE